MNGAVDSVSIFGPITFVMAFVSPALTLILISFLWFGPRKLRIPAVLPGIPLALASIALQVTAGTMGILRAFQEISTNRIAGVRNVAGSVALVTGSLPLSIVLSIGSIMSLLVIQALRDRRDNELEGGQGEKGLAARIAFFLAAISVLACSALLWLFERTVDLIMVIVDSTRGAEAQEKLGQVPIGDVASIISHRLVACDLLSLLLFPLLLIAPLSLFVREVPEWVRMQSWTLGLLTMLVLIAFGFAFHQELLYMISLTQHGVPHP